MSRSRNHLRPALLLSAITNPGASGRPSPASNDKTVVAAPRGVGCLFASVR